MSESETMFTFDAWRRYLEFDADQVGMRETVKVMSDATLESLWRAGIQPTVRAVIQYCESPGPVNARIPWQTQGINPHRIMSIKGGEQWRENPRSRAGKKQ